MKLIPIEVECHSGYKADEYPKYFTLDNDRFEIRQVMDRWYQGETNPEFPVSNYFKVETTTGVHFISTAYRSLLLKNIFKNSHKSKDLSIIKI